MYDLLQQRPTQTGPAPAKPAGRTKTKRELTQEAAAKSPVAKAAATTLPPDIDAVFKAAEGDAEARQLLEAFWSSSGPTATLWMRRITDELLAAPKPPPARPGRPPAAKLLPARPAANNSLKSKMLVSVQVRHGAKPGGYTDRTDRGFLITICPTTDPLPGTASGQAAHPINVSMLADELYTVYQALISKQIEYERQPTETPKEEALYSVRAYDILDELETKITATMSLRDQGLKLDYLDQLLNAHPNAVSYPIMRQLYLVLDQLAVGRPADQPVTVAEVKSLFLKTIDTAEPALLRLYSMKHGYHEDMNIKYTSVAEGKSKFTEGLNDVGGVTYFKEKIRNYLRDHPQYLKANPRFKGLEREKVVDLLYKDEQAKLKARGVRYKFNPDFDPNDNKPENQ